MGWKTADFGEKPALARAIDELEPSFTLNPDTSFIDTLDLPFYPKTRLLKLMGPGVPEAPRWYARLPGETVRIDGGISGIHYCNAHAPLMVTDDTIYAYIRFYYYFSSGARVFEGRIKRSAVGYTGKIWFYEKNSFFESDVNITAKGLVTELERVPVPDVPDFRPEEFSL